MVAVKLFLLFNILNFYHKAFLAWNGVVKNPWNGKNVLWLLSPILKTFCIFLFATRNIPSIKNTSGFRGFILGLAVRLNIAPIRCNYFPLCPIGRFVGVNSSLKIKKYPWKCVEKGLWENGMNVACGMEMSISLKLCGAEVDACNEGEM